MPHDVLAALTVEQVDDLRFTGPQLDSVLARTFGGQVAAQAHCAAQATVPDKAIASLHTYFISAGDSTAPIDFQVEVIRDGRSFSHRSVRGFQHGREIVRQNSLFQAPGMTGPQRSDAPSTDLVPSDDPQTYITETSQFMGKEWDQWDIRLAREFAGQSPMAALSGDPRRFWVRNTATHLPADPAFHAAATTYFADMSLIHAILVDDPFSAMNLTMASLDHELWFHRPLDITQWMVFEQHSPAAFGGTGIAHGRIYDAQGQLAVTVAQHGLARD